MKVNYICIGTQKSGSTSLINYLNQHPNIYCLRKEPHFFDKPKGIKFNRQMYRKYQRKFTTRKKNCIVGEKTPSYSYLPFAINRIKQYNKNMKIIFLLREPISRFISQYKMDSTTRGHKYYGVPFGQFIRNELTGINPKPMRRGGHYLIRGFYDKQIKHLFKKFPKKNIYIGISEEIRKDKQKYYNQIFTFLGKNNIKININKDTRIGSSKKIPTKYAKILYKIYKPHLENLYKIIGKRIEPWENYYKSLVGNA